MKYSCIRGTGSYLPAQVVTNYDLEKKIETTHQWIVERTGIHSRHIAEDHESALSMAEAAGRAALAMAGIAAADLDMIIVATTTPERVFPATACELQAALGAGQCPAFDLNATACAGFMYGIGIADQFIRTGKIKHALVIGSEMMSRIVDWSDRRTCVLFGDGAGAVVLSSSDTPGIMTTCLHADGRFVDMLNIPSNLGRPTSRKFTGQAVLNMQGNTLFRQAVNILGGLFDETLAAGGVSAKEIDWLIPHQANLRIIDAMAKKLDLPTERVAITLATHANTSSASIPLALDGSVRDGRIKRGDLLLLEGFGGGLAWGSALVRF